ncbi:MAG: hypothetical protein HXY24_01585 [Rubrivivax sp.]|nr:hypothetical protein [Rubrivivax sp.]
MAWRRVRAWCGAWILALPSLATAASDGDGGRMLRLTVAFDDVGHRAASLGAAIEVRLP